MMRLLNRRKGQSLEKVEKLCRTATSGNSFLTQNNNSDHSCATQNIAKLHLRMRRMIETRQRRREARCCRDKRQQSCLINRVRGRELFQTVIGPQNSFAVARDAVAFGSAQGKVR
jgi:hypothetical protein